MDRESQHTRWERLFDVVVGEYLEERANRR
jgi:hypothetical protein